MELDIARCCECNNKVETIREYYTNIQCKKELILYFILDIINLIVDYFEPPNCQKCIGAVTHVSNTGLIISYVIKEWKKYQYHLTHKVLFLTSPSFIRENQPMITKIKKNNRPQITASIGSRIHIFTDKNKPKLKIRRKS